MERVENRYFDLQGLHQVNRLNISSVLWSLGVKNKTPCWESGVSKFKIFQTKQTKAKFSLRNKHWQKYRYIKWRKETQPLHSLMLFSAGSRFRISHSFTKSVFFFPSHQQSYCRCYSSDPERKLCTGNARQRGDVGSSYQEQIVTLSH